jgi:hypothetical protein
MRIRVDSSDWPADPATVSLKDFAALEYDLINFFRTEPKFTKIAEYNCTASECSEATEEVKPVAIMEWVLTSDNIGLTAAGAMELKFELGYPIPELEAEDGATPVAGAYYQFAILNVTHTSQPLDKA